MPVATNRIRKHYSATSGLPKCGRHLSRPEQPPAGQVLCGNHSTMQTTSNVEEVTCRHCLREMKLLPAVAASFSDTEGEEEMEDGDE